MYSLPSGPKTQRPALTRSTRRWTLANVVGGGERDRTDDILLAKQALSQLSYTPIPAAIATATSRLPPPAQIPGGSGWIRTNDPRLIKTVL